MPIDFNINSLYTIGNITGNNTGIIIYRANQPFVHLNLFEGGARKYNKHSMT